LAGCEDASVDSSGIAVISITASRRVRTFILLNCWCQPCGVSVPLDHSTLSVPCVEILQLGPVVYNSRSATRRRDHRCGTRTVMQAATLFRDRKRPLNG